MRGDEVSIRAAANRSFLQIKTDFRRKSARVLKQLSGFVCAHQRRAIYSPAHFDPCAVDYRLKVQHRFSDSLTVLDFSKAHIDRSASLRGDNVGEHSSASYA